jgi:hypothetical protein
VQEAKSLNQLPTKSGTNCCSRRAKTHAPEQWR